jgi:hypothetical protein
MKTLSILLACAIVLLFLRVDIVSSDDPQK